MVTVEGALLRLYAVLLRLYPRQFRQDFAAEMQTVFGDALASARRDGLRAVVRLCGREARELPGALAREHWQSRREKETSMEDQVRFRAGQANQDPDSREAPASWGEIFLAVLPFLLLMLLYGGLPDVLVEAGLLEWKSAGLRLVLLGIAALLVACAVGIFFLAWRRQWPAWSATWFPFFSIPPLALAGGLAAWLAPGWLDQEAAVFVWLPCFLAVLLYAVTRLDPRRGLLAALPVTFLLWHFNNMESVPAGIRLAILPPILLLVCLAVAFVLRRGDWRAGLFAILAANLAVGAVYAYVGIYHGGTLPFVAPGPSLVEAARSFIPQYLATGAILLGPLFAWRFRQVGRSGGLSGRVGYHLALAALLLIIMANLAAKIATEAAGSALAAAAVPGLPRAAILLGLGLYLLGVFFLYRGARLPRPASGWAARVLLPLLPLAIPLALLLPFITSRWPVSPLYGIPLLWELPHAASLSAGLAWLGLSVWVVAHAAGGPARPRPAVGEAPGATQPG